MRCPSHSPVCLPAPPPFAFFRSCRTPSRCGRVVLLTCLRFRAEQAAPDCPSRLQQGHGLMKGRSMHARPMYQEQCQADDAQIHSRSYSQTSECRQLHRYMSARTWCWVWVVGQGVVEFANQRLSQVGDLQQTRFPVTHHARASSCSELLMDSACQSEWRLTAMHRQCYHIMLSGRFKNTAADQVRTPGRLACCRSKMAKKSLLSDCKASREQLCLKGVH